jgi:hypothetical protein
MTRLKGRLEGGKLNTRPCSSSLDFTSRKLLSSFYPIEIELLPNRNEDVILVVISRGFSIIVLDI